MTPVPDDLWPCAYLSIDVRHGRAVQQVAAFLVRAATRERAMELAEAFGQRVKERTGAAAVHVAVNGVPGERAVLDSSRDMASVCKSQEPTHTYVVRETQDYPGE